MDETRVFNPLDLNLSRSIYNVHPHSMGTCIAGRLIPAYTWNVLPGDEFSVNNLHSLFKMSTPVYPTMDYLYADIAFYFVPYKLIMGRRYGSPNVNDKEQSWSGFIGAQDFNINMPVPADGVKLPVVPLFTNVAGSLGQYLYGPDAANVKETGKFVNALPFMAYLAIWNENYREPNLQPPVTWNYYTDSRVGDSRKVVMPETTPYICISASEISAFGYEGVSEGDYVECLTLASEDPDIGTNCPLPTSVFHGYFGSMLPWPQRNTEGVSLPVGDFAPVETRSQDIPSLVATKPAFALKGGAVTYSASDSTAGENYHTIDAVHKLLGQGADSMQVRTVASPEDVGAFGNAFVPSNLWANLKEATAIDVEMLRALITKQHWYEDIARSGNRLDELEYGTFGVRPKDSGCDRPMYLGGKRLQLNVEMVASTNGGTTSGAAAGSGSLGDLGAFSHTNDEGFYFHQGFDTWGCIQMVFTIRCHNLIASGIDRHWLKSGRDEWYWPEFANLGNQYTSEAEIAAGGQVSDVLGYQEYAEEWREPRDMVTGLLVPGKSLGFMTYAHRYTSAPTLAEVLDASKQFLDIDRTLAVKQSASGFQFIYQFTAETKIRRSVGKYSIPGVSRV